MSIVGNLLHKYEVKYFRSKTIPTYHWRETSLLAYDVLLRSSTDRALLWHQKKHLKAWARNFRFTVSKCRILSKRPGKRWRSSCGSSRSHECYSRDCGQGWKDTSLPERFCFPVLDIPSELVSIRRHGRWGKRGENGLAVTWPMKVRKKRYKIMDPWKIQER